MGGAASAGAASADSERGVCENGPVAYLRSSFSELFLGQKLNVLMLFIPVACVIKLRSDSRASADLSGDIDSKSEIWLFLSTGLALMSVSERIGWITEQLALHVKNAAVVGVLNASCGNVPELLFCIAAVRQGSAEMVQHAMVGAVLSNLLLVTGLTFLVGGLRRHAQPGAKRGDLTYNAQITSVFVLLLLLAALAVALCAFLPGEEVVITPVGHPNTHDYPLLVTSRAFSIVLLLAYVAAMVMQLVTHRELFDEAGEEDGERPVLGLVGALVWINVFSFLAGTLSDFLVDSIAGAAARLNTSTIFLTAIVIPNLNNSPEHFVALRFALASKVDTAIAITVGSAAQLAVFVLPFAVLFAWPYSYHSGEAMTLKFARIESAGFIFCVLIGGFVLQAGRATWATGTFLVLAYAIIALGFFWQPTVEAEMRAVVVGASPPPAAAHALLRGAGAALTRGTGGGGVLLPGFM